MLPGIRRHDGYLNVAESSFQSKVQSPFDNFNLSRSRLVLALHYVFHLLTNVALFACISFHLGQHGSPFVLEINVGSFEGKFALNQLPITNPVSVILR